MFNFIRNVNFNNIFLLENLKLTKNVVTNVTFFGARFLKK